MLDLFVRAETPATLRTVIRSAPFRNIIGDLREPNGGGGIRSIPGAVDFVVFLPNTVVITPATYDGNGDIITPAVTDAWCWLQLRLSGTARSADFEGDPYSVRPDRWDFSRLKRWMKDNGTLRTIRGVSVYEHTLGNGKRIQVWRGAQMEALGVNFHEYLGGNSY